MNHRKLLRMLMSAALCLALLFAAGCGAPAPASSASAAEGPQTVTVVIPEGFTWELAAQRLEEAGVCSREDFFKVCQSYQPKSLTVPENSDRAFRMEGYLFPATYEFQKGENPEDVLIEMLNAYRMNAGDLTDEALIIASIVEREARGDMKKIAGVVYNRLRTGMQLQMDSTRDYVNQNITDNSLIADSGRYAELYNTYKCASLPAGPICNPGAEAMNAAQNPEEHDYLFFFYGNDNQDHFSVTLEEHEAAMETYGVQY